MGYLTMKKWINILGAVLLYLSVSTILRPTVIGPDGITVLGIPIAGQSVRGMITQTMMFMSVYLVLKHNKTGYIVSLSLNIYSAALATFSMIQTQTSNPLPGIISYAGTMVLITLIMLHITEITRQKKVLQESEDQLYAMAFYDSLSGLANKDLFVKELDKAIVLLKGEKSIMGIMFVDLDSFKSVNDTLGHSAGDVVLQIVAKRIQACLEKEDMVARFGGDEFLIRISSAETINELHKMVDHIFEAFKKPITVQNIDFSITVSAGVALYPVDGETPETLIKNADIAMYLAKKNGRNQCAYCTEKMKDDIVKELTMTNNLYQALQKKELSIAYQPQVSVETQEIIGFEALLRWKNPEYGVVSPEVFIPLVEATGMIIPMGLWVLEAACKQNNEFRKISKKD